MSYTRRSATGALAALLMALALAGCGAGGGTSGPAEVAAGSIPDKPEAGTFTMGIEPWLGYGAWWIAQDKGMFTGQGMDVKITNFEEDAQINTALASGKIDAANIATHTAMKMIQSGIPITAVLLEDQSEKADAIMAKDDITSIKQLKGQKVAYEEGTTSDILLNYALKQNGMTRSDISKVPMPAANVGAALLAGKVNIGVTYEPYLSQIKAKGGYHYLFTAGEDPGLVSDVLVVRNDVIKNKPGQVLAMVKAWAQSSQYLADHPSEGQALIAKNVGASAASLKTAFDGVKIYTLPESAKLMEGAFASKTVADVSSAAQDAGILDAPVTAKEFLNDTFVKVATK